jgi:Glycosyl transferase family 2
LPAIDASIVDNLLDRDIDFADVAIVAGLLPAGVDGHDSTATVTPVLESSDEEAYEVVTGRSEMLVTSNNYYPGCVAVIDADLQDPPEVIADMTATWREGYDVVYGVRASRQGESRLKLFTAAPYYRLLSRIVKIDIPVDVGDFRLMSRRTADGEPRLRHNRHRVFWCCSGGSAIASGDREGSNEQPLRLTSAVLMSANGCYAGVPRQPHGVIGGKFAAY